MATCNEENSTPFVWNISNFSKLKPDRLYSSEFSRYGRKFRLCLYPLGYGNAKGTHISIFLVADGLNDMDDGLALHMTFTLSMIQQENQTTHSFEAPSDSYKGGFHQKIDSKGWRKFFPLTSLKDERGYLKDDVLICGCTISALAVSWKPLAGDTHGSEMIRSGDFELDGKPFQLLLRPGGNGIFVGCPYMYLRARGLCTRLYFSCSDDMACARAGKVYYANFDAGADTWGVPLPSLQCNSQAKQ